jgi:hypothetical protein
VKYPENDFQTPNGDDDSDSSKPEFHSTDPSTLSFISNDGAEAIFRSLRIGQEDVDAEGASDASNGQYKRRPFKYDHPWWHLGWTDGRLGEPREINEALLRAHYRAQWLERVEFLSSRLAHNRAQIPRLQDMLDRIRSKLKLAQNRFEGMWEKRFHAYYEFSYLLAAVYVVIATILFLSDVPLTLKLVARGFDLKTQVIDPTTQEVVLSVDDLIRRPTAVFSYLWEPLVLALGIALAGVFIKFFLDEVIFREKVDDARKVRITLWVILMVFLLTITTLGLFRAHIQRDLQESDFQIHEKSIEASLRTQGLNEDEIKKSVESLVRPREESTLATVTFIALTVTLPIIAGVCFSAGWRRFKNARHYREAKGELKRLENDQELVFKELTTVEAEIVSDEQRLAYEEQERSSSDPITELNLNLYRHGYYRGLNVPETIDHGSTLYSRSKRAVEKIIATRLQRRMWDDIDEKEKELVRQ